MKVLRHPRIQLMRSDGPLCATASRQSNRCHRAASGAHDLRTRPAADLALGRGSQTPPHDSRSAGRTGSRPISLPVPVSRRGAQAKQLGLAGLPPGARQAQHFHSHPRSGEGVEPSSAIRRAPPVLKFGLQWSAQAPPRALSSPQLRSGDVRSAEFGTRFGTWFSRRVRRPASVAWMIRSSA